MFDTNDIQDAPIVVPELEPFDEEELDMIFTRLQTGETEKDEE